MVDFAGFNADSGSLPVDQPGRTAAVYVNPVVVPFEGALLPEGELFGPSAVGSRVLPAPVDHSGFCAVSVAEDWVDRIHVIPRRFDFGNILGVINTPVDVFSAFRDQDVSFTAFVNNSGPGLSIIDLPTLPDTLEPFSGLSMTVEVTTNGVPSFNTTMDFVFDVGTVEVPITGTRVTIFPYAPNQPLTEQLEFKTDVLEKKDGNEQRIALRKNPRQSFSMKLDRLEGTQRSRVDFTMFDWQSRVFGIPVWMEPMALTSAASITDTVVNVDTTDFADLRVGGLAIIMAPDEVTFDALEIASIGPTSITFNSPLENDYPVGGTQVYPIRTAIAGQTMQGSRRAFGFAQFDINFRVLDNDSDLADASAFNTFEGKVFLDGPNAIENSLRESYQRRVVVFDSETGVFSQDSPWTRNRRGTTKTFITNSRQALWEVRQLLHFLRGRQISFWMPTFYKEIVPTALLPSGGSSMTITNVGYAQFVQDRAPKNKFRVVLKDGTLLERTVAGSAEIDKNEEQLTFTTTWPSTIQVEDIERVELVEPVRIDSDRIRLTHDNSKGQSTITFPVKVVFE